MQEWYFFLVCSRGRHNLFAQFGVVFAMCCFPILGYMSVFDTFKNFPVSCCLASLVGPGSCPHTQIGSPVLATAFLRCLHSDVGVFLLSV